METFYLDEGLENFFNLIQIVHKLIHNYLFTKLWNYLIRRKEKKGEKLIMETKTSI
jgi:hypothetical protein